MINLLIWGTGREAETVLDNGINANILGFIETNRTKKTFHCKNVYSASEMPNDYDYILVANSYVSEISELCKLNAIDMTKVIFMHRVIEKSNAIDTTTLLNILGEKNYTIYCQEFNIIENSFYERDKDLYQKLNKRKNFCIDDKYNWPIISDKYSMAGTMNNYFWQDLWAAKKIVKSGVKEHYDIGSRIDGFIAHLLTAGIKVNMIDIRPFPGVVENLYTVVDDATELAVFDDNSISSLSALCSLEHFGLGRYGDKIDPEACFKCFSNIQKKIVIGGNLYISLPIGRERIEFNAHRVFYASTVVSLFNQMELVDFSCTAEGKLEKKVELCKYDNDPHNGEFRYGLFHFRKK